jgi:Protein of unknown function (DUF2934)
MASSDVRPGRSSKASSADSPPKAMLPAVREPSYGPLWIPDKVERGEAPLDAVVREEMIRTVAYLRAESRGFGPGHELDDWIGAERQIDDWIATRAAPRRHGR